MYFEAVNQGLPHSIMINKSLQQDGDMSIRNRSLPHYSYHTTRITCLSVLFNEIVGKNSYMYEKVIWPASREKGPSDISHSVDLDQPPNNVENAYMKSYCLHSKKNKSH